MLARLRMADLSHSRFAFCPLKPARRRAAQLSARSAAQNCIHYGFCVRISATVCAVIPGKTGGTQMKLDNRVAVVTGAGRSQGIGEAIAMRLAREGARVVVVDLCRQRPDLP